MLSTDLLQHYRQLSQGDFTVVDLETTGYLPSESRAIEVSVLQASLRDGVQQHQTDLINPQVLIPPQITRFTGISQDMVDAAALSNEVWTRYLPLLSTGILTAHNFAFDYSFLQAEYENLQVEFCATQQLCTVQLARLMLPDLPSRSLPNLVRYFQFSVGRSHRAEADTLACWLLAERLLIEIQTETDAELLARFAQEWLPLHQAANLLGCSTSAAQKQLASAGVEPRISSRSRARLYRRGAIEQLILQNPGQQLSLI